MSSAVAQGDVTFLSLWTPDPSRAAVFYTAVLGWDIKSVNDYTGAYGLSLPQGLWTAQAPTTFVCFAVEDLDAAVERVQHAGGAAGPPTDDGHGRVALCSDGLGWKFGLHAPPEGTVSRGSVPVHDDAVAGDTVYLTYETPDTDHLKGLLQSVLGWDFAPGEAEQSWEVTTRTRPLSGVHGGAEEPRTDPAYRVEDISTAIAAVQAHGGTASSPVERDYGLLVDAHDNQGTHFYMLET